MSFARLVGLGVFVVVGLLAFTFGLFVIGSRRGLFADRFAVTAEFARVSGLEPGATVRVAGIDGGEVEAIHVPGGPLAKFQVKMKVLEKLHPLVRADSVATIQTDGLVGSKFVQIDVGSDRTKPVEENGTILSREPFDFNTLLEQVSQGVTTATETINSIRTEIENALVQINDTVSHADALIVDVGADVKAMSQTGERAVQDVQAIVADLRAGRGTVGKLITDEELYTNVREISREVEQAVEKIREAAQEARQAVESFRAKEGPTAGLTADLRHTLANAREATSDLAENMEALKRNWFLRGFFRNRGYFDLDSISPADYRAGALEGGKRAPLRIWLRAVVLFSTDPDGSEEPTAEGRARIDSAMAEFLRYPAQSALVVEGYASSANSRDEAYLRSRTRAALVREYIVSKFRDKPSTVGAIGLGGEAQGSPDGGTWDGVAITLFAERAAIQKARTSSGR